MRVLDANWMQIEKCLRRDGRVARPAAGARALLLENGWAR